MNRLSSDIRLRRWPGVLLSLIVPGFGTLRAGFRRRACVWFFGMQMASLATGISFALDSIPFWLVVISFSITILLQMGMLYDSFRPGRMTLSLWVLFAISFTAILSVPTPGSWVARGFRTPTSAMEPTLIGPRSALTPDHMIADRLTYLFKPPQRGDLIIFNTSSIPELQHLSSQKKEEVFFIKRVVGLPGERVRIHKGKVLVNGKELGVSDGIPALPYVVVDAVPSSANREGEDYVVGPNEYFALGDNSEISFDSRYWGCVPAASIYGKVTLIYYPFNRAGRIPSLNHQSAASPNAMNRKVP